MDLFGPSRTPSLGGKPYEYVIVRNIRLIQPMVITLEGEG